MPTVDAIPAGAPCWIELFTSDTDSGRAFYRDLFGWTSEDAGPEYGGRQSHGGEPPPSGASLHLIALRILHGSSSFRVSFIGG